MANSSAAEMPAPDAGSNSQPNAAVTPRAEPRTRRQQPHAAPLTKAQQREVTLTLALCAAGLLPEYAAGLAANTVPAPFLNTLKTDAENAGKKGQDAVCSTNQKEGFTADEATTRQALMTNLRTIQSAARAVYGDTQPERVQDYLVGNDIDANRPALEANAQAIIQQANMDRPGSIDTNFINATTDRRTGYVQSHASQQSQQGAGKQQRAERNQMIGSIRARRKKIQRAADTAWPHTNPANAKARTVFRLPANRPYSY